MRFAKKIVNSIEKWQFVHGTIILDFKYEVRKILQRRFRYHCQCFKRKFFNCSGVIKICYLKKLLTFTKIKITFSMPLLQVRAFGKTIKF